MDMQFELSTPSVSKRGYSLKKVCAAGVLALVGCVAFNKVGEVASFDFVAEEALSDPVPTTEKPDPVPTTEKPVDESTEPTEENPVETTTNKTDETTKKTPKTWDSVTSVFDFTAAEFATNFPECKKAADAANNTDMKTAASKCVKEIIAKMKEEVKNMDFGVKEKAAIIENFLKDTLPERIGNINDKIDFPLTDFAKNAWAAVAPRFKFLDDFAECKVVKCKKKNAALDCKKEIQAILKSIPYELIKSRNITIQDKTNKDKVKKCLDTVSTGLKYYKSKSPKDQGFITTVETAIKVYSGLFSSKISKWVWIGLGVLAVAVAGGLAYYFLVVKKKKSTKKSTKTSTPVSSKK